MMKFNELKSTMKTQYLFMLTFMLIVSSCLKEDEQSNSLEETALITELLCAHHSGECDLKVEANSVVLEGDMVFPKEELLSFLDASKKEDVKHLSPDGTQYLDREPDIESRNRIYGFRQFISQHEARDITYRFLPSLRDNGGTCDDGWEQAVRDAAKAYNDLAGVKLFFREIMFNSFEDPDIIIGCDNDPYFNTTTDNRNSFYNISGAGKARGVGGDRKPGKYISVNDTYNGAMKTPVMIHEFGHTIGFRHTDTFDGAAITCGQKSEYTFDPRNSIFASSFSASSFHYTDERSIRHLWPENLQSPINGSLESRSSDWVRFKFRNPSNTTKPYTEIVLAHSVNGNWQVARFWCDAPNSVGEYDIYWWANGLFANGNHQFWVKGVSHAEEEGSAWCNLGGFNR